MCAVQHEPPRVPLTARPNPLPTPEFSSAGMMHPGMGQPSVPAAALLWASPSLGRSPAWPQRDRQLPVLPGRSVVRISSCGTLGSANPFLAPQPSARTHLDLFLQEIFKGLMGSTAPRSRGEWGGY